MGGMRTSKIDCAEGVKWKEQVKLHGTGLLAVTSKGYSIKKWGGRIFEIVGVFVVVFETFKNIDSHFF